MKVVMVMRHAVLAALASALLNGCSYIDSLKAIGQQPPLTAVDNPTTRPGYKPVQMPMPAAQPASYNPNSLWRNGSRAFFKDQRAHQIGDILTVKVNFTGKANIDNETKRSRAMTEDSGINNFFGKPKVPIMNTPVPTRIFTSDSNTTMDGKGSVNRQEALQTNVAGVVTQVLPNGNLVIEGKQEIRVNFEVRELIVAGIVRPEDIESDNTIDSSKIARARIAFGGRGQITKCSRTVTESKFSTCCCRSSQWRKFCSSRAVFASRERDGVYDAASGCSPAGGRVNFCERQKKNARLKKPGICFLY